MAILVKFRRATQSEWSSANPVLDDGEIVIEEDTTQVKIGDGSTNYNSLGYAFDPGDDAAFFNDFF